MTTKTTKKIALAIDNISALKQIESLIDATQPWIDIYKIGLEQFIRFGPPIVQTIQSAGKKIFLDLKLHDIPNTVAQAVLSACKLEVDYLTIHTQGGVAMMQSAMLAKKDFSTKSPTKIIGVTLLTSINEYALHNELNVEMKTAEYVRHLAQQAVKAEINGIVCSALDLTSVTPIVPEHFEIITPGIRPAGSSSDDQKRVATPSQAIRDGATILVIGRAITSSPNPAAAAQKIYDEVHADN